MKHDDHGIDETRRWILQLLLASPALGLAGCGASAATTGGGTPSSPSSTLSPTPACSDDDDDPTPAQTQGPYFKPNSPQRASLLESGLAGTRLTISGRVLSTACAPISAALLDFWHADDAGNYDNARFRLRGHQFTDSDGRFTLDTIVPGLYPGRTRHIHVKAQAPNRPILTTQLYFPSEPRNATDGLYSAALLMDVQDAAGTRTATFDFILAV
jgi:protocatechuate 3,4-dioxygenase beta subunit